MTGLKPYPEYRDSEVEWLGTVPSHWRVGRIAYAYSLTLGKMLNSASGVGELRPYLRAGNVQDYGIDLNEVKEMPFTASEALSLDLRAGDVVVVEGGGGFGRSDYLRNDLIGWSFQNHVIRARPLDAQRGRYLDFFIKFLRARGHFESLGSYATIPNVSAEKLGGIVFPFLPLKEQESIAHFLDIETAEIDAFIAGQEELIALLFERRNAAAVHATLGRNDYAHRGMLGRFLLKLSRPISADAEVVTAFRDGVVTARSNRREEGFTFSDTEGGYQAVHSGDLVFHGLDGFSGAAGISDSDGKCSPVYHVCEVRPAVDPQYVAMYLRSLGSSGFLGAYAWSVRQRSVDYRNWSVFSKLPVKFPSLEEQRLVVSRVTKETKAIDEALADAREAISLSKERRAALISEAVTGKIDVRALVRGTA